MKKKNITRQEIAEFKGLGKIKEDDIMNKDTARNDGYLLMRDGSVYICLITGTLIYFKKWKDFRSVWPLFARMKRYIEIGMAMNSADVFGTDMDEVIDAINTPPKNIPRRIKHKRSTS